MKGTNEKYAKLGQRVGEVVTLFLPTFRIWNRSSSDLLSLYNESHPQAFTFIADGWMI